MGTDLAVRARILIRRCGASQGAVPAGRSRLASLLGGQIKSAHDIDREPLVFAAIQAAAEGRCREGLSARDDIIRPKSTGGIGALKVTVRLFAGYREKAGRSEVELELQDGSTVGDLVANVVSQFPDISPRPESLVVAVNLEYQAHGFGLGDGDEVALIPPVSGGRHD